jgi:membrane-bound lytic murein transglycosylase B
VIHAREQPVLPADLALKLRLFAGVMALTCATVSPAQPLKPEVETFIKLMAERHQFDVAQLTRIFGSVRPQAGVVKSTTAPATSKPWLEFRAIMLTPLRIEGGVKFWSEHAEALARARAVYGVPEEYIVAIIGVESRYGRLMGSYRVLDALYTNAFEMNLRAEFFRGELEQFLLLTRENGLDPLSVKGSFAGAMGMPQFIPTSYRKHAVDFDGDGKINLWDDVEDVIGSVASYLRDFGWAADAPVVLPASISAGQAEPLLVLGLKPHSTVSALRTQGVDVSQDVSPQLLGGVVAYELSGSTEYWVSLNNFWVITRYNRSKNYAMAVHQLAQEVASEYQRSRAIAAE